jgi:hypothetical protein
VARERVRHFRSAGKELNLRVANLASALLGDRWQVWAIEGFFNEDIANLDDAECEFAFPAILYWDRAIRGEQSFAELWEEHNSPAIEQDAQEYLTAFMTSYLSIWNVRHVEPGVGVGLVDALTGRDAFVHDASAASRLRLHQAILAIVLECDAVRFFGGVHPVVLDSPASDAVVDAARRICRARGRAVTRDELWEPGVKQKIIAAWRSRGRAVGLSSPPGSGRTIAPR